MKSHTVSISARPVPRLHLDESNVRRADADEIPHAEARRGPRDCVTAGLEQSHGAVFVAAAFRLRVADHREPLPATALLRRPLTNPRLTRDDHIDFPTIPGYSLFVTMTALFSGSCGVTPVGSNPPSRIAEFTGVFIE
jgi:hypothetical protein